MKNSMYGYGQESHLLYTLGVVMSVKEEGMGEHTMWGEGSGRWLYTPSSVGLAFPKRGHSLSVLMCPHLPHLIHFTMRTSTPNGLSRNCMSLA